MDGLAHNPERWPDAYRVGGWLAQPALNRLTDGTRTLRVRPQLMDVLVCLSRHPGRAVPREQLLSEVWPDRHVSDSGINRCIAELRHVLGDHPRQSVYIETITKRGYRLVAPVAAAGTRKDEAALSTPRRWLQFAACAFAGAISGVSKP